MDIVKISVLGIAGIVLGLFLKESKPEYSLYVSVCICLVIVGYSVTKLLTLFDSFRQLQQYIPIDSQYTFENHRSGLSWPVFGRRLQGCRIFLHGRPD